MKLPVLYCKLWPALAVASLLSQPLSAAPEKKPPPAPELSRISALQAEVTQHQVKLDACAVRLAPLAPHKFAQDIKAKGTSLQGRLHKLRTDIHKEKATREKSAKPVKPKSFQGDIAKLDAGAKRYASEVDIACTGTKPKSTL